MTLTIVLNSGKTIVLPETSKFRVSSTQVIYTSNGMENRCDLREVASINAEDPAEVYELVEA